MRKITYLTSYIVKLAAILHVKAIKAVQASIQAGITRAAEHAKNAGIVVSRIEQDLAVAKEDVTEANERYIVAFKNGSRQIRDLEKEARLYFQNGTKAV